MKQAAPIIRRPLQSARLLVKWCLVAAVVTTCMPLAAQEDVDTDRVVQRYADSDWYDADSNSYVKPTLRSSEEDSPIRTDGRLASPKSPQANRAKGSKNGNNGGGGGRWGLAGLGDFFSGFTLFWLGLFLVVIIGALAYFSFRNYLPSFRKDEKVKVEIKIDPSRIEDLPFEVPEVQSFDDPLQQIQAFVQAGRLREATILLYGYKLLVLDQANRIELQKGKTNRTYLRELKSGNRLSGILETTMLAFEDVFFGDHVITAERFQTSWSLLGEFQELAVGTSQ